ncbi:MAG: hemerythrin domain-containing protein [Thermoplasmatota archaeon]
MPEAVDQAHGFIALMEDHAQARGALDAVDAVMQQAEETWITLRDEIRMLRDHFDEEEAVLLPVLDALPGGEHLAARLVEDHRELRREFREFLADGQARLTPMRLVADRLRAHLNWEESVLLPHLAQRLPLESMEAIEQRCATFRRVRRGTAVVHQADRNTFRNLHRELR